MNKTEYTPWGFTNHFTKLTEGITWYDTPSHGGYKVDEFLLQTMPEKARIGFAGYGWYEEDCDAAVVIHYFPQHFTKEQVKIARELIASYDKLDGYYTKTFGLIL